MEELSHIQTTWTGKGGRWKRGKVEKGEGGKGRRWKRGKVEKGEGRKVENGRWKRGGGKGEVENGRWEGGK